MLSTIAGSVISVAGVTFSITIAALSLASSQYGPRLISGFMRDRDNQFLLGTYTATFIYCLLILRTIRGSRGEGSPQRRRTAKRPCRLPAMRHLDNVGGLERVRNQFRTMVVAILHAGAENAPTEEALYRVPHSPEVLWGDSICALGAFGVVFCG